MASSWRSFARCLPASSVLCHLASPACPTPTAVQPSAPRRAEARRIAALRGPADGEVVPVTERSRATFRHLKSYGSEDLSVSGEPHASTCAGFAQSSHTRLSPHLRAPTASSSSRPGCATRPLRMSHPLAGRPTLHSRLGMFRRLQQLTYSVFKTSTHVSLCSRKTTPKGSAPGERSAHTVRAFASAGNESTCRALRPGLHTRHRTSDTPSPCGPHPERLEPRGRDRFHRRPVQPPTSPAKDAFHHRRLGAPRPMGPSWSANQDSRHRRAFRDPTTPIAGSTRSARSLDGGTRVASIATPSTRR